MRSKNMIRFLVLFLVFSFHVFCDEGKFLLLLGPSGAGKSTIIHHLKEMDSRFIYISPYTTRDLRPGESDKVHVPLEIIQQMESDGRLLTVNCIYGIYYATPKDVIDSALTNGQFPILDWPVEKMGVMLEHYQGKLFTTYIEPDDLDELQRRLSLDGRDKEGRRFAAGIEELHRYHQGEFDKIIDLKILNRKDQDQEIARQIYQKFTE